MVNNCRLVITPNDDRNCDQGYPYIIILYTSYIYSWTGFQTVFRESPGLDNWRVGSGDFVGTLLVYIKLNSDFQKCICIIFMLTVMVQYCKHNWLFYCNYFFLIKQLFIMKKKLIIRSKIGRSNNIFFH